MRSFLITKLFSCLREQKKWSKLSNININIAWRSFLFNIKSLDSHLHMIVFVKCLPIRNFRENSWKHFFCAKYTNIDILHDEMMHIAILPECRQLQDDLYKERRQLWYFLVIHLMSSRYHIVSWWHAWPNLKGSIYVISEALHVPCLC